MLAVIHFFLFVLILGTLACAPKNSDSNFAHSESRSGIIGGKPASPEDLVTKSTVSLIIDYAGKPFSICTGTLISRDLILTASHCLENLGEGYMYVYMGAKLPKVFNKADLLQVQEWTLHPNYQEILDSEKNMVSGANDVALIKLKDFAPVSALPVAILDENTVLKTGQPLLLAGFGITNEKTYPPAYADGLNSVQVPLHKTQGQLLITDQTLAKGGCNGDSGGPAYLQSTNALMVVGITRGPHAGARDCRHYGEYTNASMFKDFILQTAQKLQAERPNFVTLH